MFGLDLREALGDVRRGSVEGVGTALVEDDATEFERQRVVQQVDVVGGCAVRLRRAVRGIIAAAGAEQDRRAERQRSAEDRASGEAQLQPSQRFRCGIGSMTLPPPYQSPSHISK